MKEKTKKLISALLTVILVISFIIVGIGFYQKFTGKNIIPYHISWVMTESMEDTIPKESFVLIKDVNPKDIKENDIITFISEDPDIYGLLNTHRVIEIIGNNEEFVTKGDNNIVKDSYTVKAEKVTGIYVCNLPIISGFGRFYKTKYGFASVLLIFVVLFVIWGKVVRKKYKEEDKEKAIQEAIKKEVERLEQESKK